VDSFPEEKVNSDPRQAEDQRPGNKSNLKSQIYQDEKKNRVKVKTRNKIRIQ